MSNKIALEALQLAYIAMQHMGNVLNKMDAVDEEEDAQHDAAFEAVSAAIAALEAGGWLPIETCPETGFFLVHKDGAIRTMFRFEGKWDHAAPPILIDQWGDSMVSNEVEKHYPGKKLGISGGILEPTHYQPLPTPPKD